MTNDGGKVSDAVSTVVQSAFGGTNIVAGMVDLEAAFTAAGATGGVFSSTRFNVLSHALLMLSQPVLFSRQHRRPI